jgi:hypothetical protein
MQIISENGEINFQSAEIIDILDQLSKRKLMEYSGRPLISQSFNQCKPQQANMRALHLVPVPANSGSIPANRYCAFYYGSHRKTGFDK